jgi:hypothetical protein
MDLINAHMPKFLLFQVRLKHSDQSQKRSVNTHVAAAVCIHSLEYSPHLLIVDAWDVLSKKRVVQPLSYCACMSDHILAQIHSVLRYMKMAWDYIRSDFLKTRAASPNKNH